MSGSQVADGWLRIEQWLAANARDTHATLRAGADTDAVADAQQRLGLSFPPDLVASLERHDGCLWSRGFFGLAGPFRPLTVAEMVQRHVETEEVLAEYAGYWERHLLMFATTSTDWGLVVDCEPGDARGRVGEWSGGEGVRWTEWPSVGALLSQVAAALESGHPAGDWVPVGFGGELGWKLRADPVVTAPSSVLAMAREPGELTVPGLGNPAPAGREGWIGAYGSLCLTFAEGIDPGELLRRFGVGAPDVPVSRETARLTSAEAALAEKSWTTGYLPVVRAGQAGRWSFAVEYGHHEGIKPTVLPRLSAGTRAAVLYSFGPELAIMKDGELVACFCGFDPDRRGGTEPALLDGPLARERILPWDPSRSFEQELRGLLAIVRTELGVELDPELLTGPLPGGPFLADLPDRAVITRGLSLNHGPRVAALTLCASPDRLQRVLVSQARELAAETGLTGYPEIVAALDRLAAGESWQVTGDSALGRRFRLLAAEHAAAWESPQQLLTQAGKTAWRDRYRGAEAIMELIAGPPHRAARFVLAERKDPGWPHRFAADLGPVVIPRGAAAEIAEAEGQEHNRAHMGAAGYRVPVWPARRP